VGRLTVVPLRLAVAPSRGNLKPYASRSAERWATRVSRPWYNSARWRALRMEVLTEALFTCANPACRKIEHDTSRLVADHKVPHRDDEDLFWNKANLQCLCKACHDSAKQRAERQGMMGGAG